MAEAEIEAFNYFSAALMLTFQKLLAALAPLTGGFQRDNGRILSLLITYHVTYHKQVPIIEKNVNGSFIINTLYFWEIHEKI